jgi:hypothetical protein
MANGLDSPNRRAPRLDGESNTRGLQIMTIRTSLVGGAALGALFALALTPAANAATHHKRHHVAAPPVDSALKSEVETLKAQVDALQAREDQDATARQQTQDQVQALQGQLAQANARAERAEQQVQAQIETIPGVVDTAVAKATPKPVTGWWDNTTVGGTVFWDLTNINEQSPVSGNPNGGLSLGNASQTATTLPSGNTGHSPNGVNFDIKRAYLQVDHTFDQTFSADVTTDFTYDYATKATQLFIKKAYLQAKVDDALVFQVGGASQPWVPFVEDFYGYRYVENVLIDRTKFGTSTDWGVHAFGKLPLGDSGATFGYSLAATNGMGYKIAAYGGGDNRSSQMDFEGRVNLNYAGFVAAVGGYDGKLGQDYAGVTTYYAAERFDGLVGYANKDFRIAGEYMWASGAGPNSAEILSSAKPDTSDAYSIFGSWNFAPKFALFGRYDWVDPKEITHPTELNTYYNVGVSWEPVKVVDFALVYKHDEIDNGAFTDSNFATASSNIHGAYNEVGVWGQFKW